MLHLQPAKQSHPATLDRAQLARSLLLLLLAAALTPVVHGQSASQHTYSAICVVAKDENRYLAEWVQYHKCLGELRCPPATGNTATRVAWSRDLLLVQHKHLLPTCTNPTASHDLCTGIGKIYLYDHNSATPLASAISSYVQEGFVEHIPFEGKWSQGLQLASCSLCRDESYPPSHDDSWQKHHVAPSQTNVPHHSQEHGLPATTC